MKAVGADSTEQRETEPDLVATLHFARELAQEAGALVLEIRRKNLLDTKFKSNDEADMVTAADLAAEKLIATALKQKFPNYSIRGEEGTNERSKSDYEWIIDPIDGTLNFSRNKPFGISIGLVHRGTSVLGAVFYPDDDTMLSAIKDKGAWINGKPVRKRTADVPLNQARIGFDVSANGNAENEIRRFEAPVRQHVNSTERIYCSTYAARRIIEGTLDAYICGGGLTPYDLAAVTVILREAGCHPAGFEGKIDFSDKKIPFAAFASSGLESDVLTILRPTIQGKHRFYSDLAKKYSNEIRLLFKGGRLLKKDGWRNVAEHCMVQTSAAEVLCSLLKLSEEESEAICSTSAIHDWKKRWERSKETEPDLARSLLDAVHPHDDLLNATNPDYLENVYLGNAEMSPKQRLQFYLDIITRENDIVRSEDRLREVEIAPRSRGLAEKANGRYWEKTRALRDEIEAELFSKLKDDSDVLTSPADIPLLIAQNIEKKWNNVSST